MEPKNTGVGSLSLLQQIFLTQESNQGLLHCRWITLFMVYVIYWHLVSLGKYLQDDGLRETGYHGHNAAERNRLYNQKKLESKGGHKAKVKKE